MGVLIGGSPPSGPIVRQPMGVVAVLSPWNFPAGEIMFLALPALAAGNTVVIKPSEVTGPRRAIPKRPAGPQQGLRFSTRTISFFIQFEVNVKKKKKPDG